VDVPPDTARYRAAEIRVETTRPSTTSGGASSVEMLMDSAATSPSPALSDVLREMPLVRVRRNSRGQSQPSVRGMEERQIAVLVDGVPLTLGWDNRTDLSVVPLVAARGVELVRGLSSVLAGPNVLGGFVEVDVVGGRDPIEPPDPFRARMEVDQTGAVAASAQAGRLWRFGDDRLVVRAGGGGSLSDGVPLASGIAQPAAGDRLLNSDRDYANAFLAARWREAEGAWASLSTMAFRAERGVTPELHLLGSEDPAPRFWRIPLHWRSVTAVSGGTGWRRTPLGRGDLEAAVGLDVQHLEIDAFASPAYADSVGGETGDDRTLTLRLLGDHTLGAGMLRTSLTWAETRHEQALPSGRSEFRQRLWSAGVEVEHPLAPGGRGERGGGDREGDVGSDRAWLSDPTITLGGSLDGASTPQTGGFAAQPPMDGWGVRGAFSVLAGDVARVHGGVSRKVRFPALRELYSGALGKFEPNPGLEPETLEVGEVGVTARPGRHELQLTVFEQRLEGSIVRAVTPTGQFRRENRGGTRSSGVEAVANLRLGAWLARADLTLQDVRLRGADPGERPEYQPEVAGGLRLEGPAPGGARLRVSGELTGRQFGADPAAGRFVALDESLWLEAGLRRTFGEAPGGLPGFRVRIAVANLTDEAVFDQLGLPRPGRTVRLEVATP
jgi:iron complex outermembrane receptor protein